MVDMAHGYYKILILGSKIEKCKHFFAAVGFWTLRLILDPKCQILQYPYLQFPYIKIAQSRFFQILGPGGVKGVIN